MTRHPVCRCCGLPLNEDELEDGDVCDMCHDLPEIELDDRSVAFGPFVFTVTKTGVTVH